MRTRFAVPVILALASCSDPSSPAPASNTVVANDGSVVVTPADSAAPATTDASVPAAGQITFTLVEAADGYNGKDGVVPVPTETLKISGAVNGTDTQGQTGATVVFGPPTGRRVQVSFADVAPLEAGKTYSGSVQYFDRGVLDPDYNWVTRGTDKIIKVESISGKTVRFSFSRVVLNLLSTTTTVAKGAIRATGDITVVLPNP